VLTRETNFAIFECKYELIRRSTLKLNWNRQQAEFPGQSTAQTEAFIVATKYFFVYLLTLTSQVSTALPTSSTVSMEGFLMTFNEVYATIEATEH
jgi:hypothetical protein